ncbi:GNAT family N-acetyltransferase [Amycolatopsis jejuensis]|uniref:GNAT family N-acetyltransferase n=1 Tax=Amycolatopsis jejuensis TaxID=330084 RepID=UPI000A4CDF6E|nr:GNAT family N-acetyltransferase [Amycolatopsis jejuensis]
MLTPGAAEQAEIDAYLTFATAAPPAVRETLGVGSLRFGPVRALAIREDPSGFFNRAGGFDASEPITVDLVGRLCRFFAEQYVPAGAIMIAPALLPPDWDSIAAKLGLTTGARYVKLARDLRAPIADPVLDSGLRVGRLDPAESREWATVMMETFGLATPREMIDLTEGFVGAPGWQQYAVWDGDHIVATGSLHLDGECADVFGGATLPEARGRGAQSALLAVRLQAARDAGCRWAVAETGTESPGERNPSLHNMLRFDFTRQYERTSWVWNSLTSS